MTHSGETMTPQELERLLLAKRAAGIGVHDFDPVTGAIYWDERVRALWGLDADEQVTYTKFLDGLHPDDRESTEAAVAAALDPDGRRDYRARYRVVHRHDGRTRWVDATGHVTFVDRRPVRLVGTVLDVTSLVEGERRLAAQRDLLDVVVQNTPVALCLVDGSDLRIRVANPAYHAMAPNRALLGSTLDEVWPAHRGTFAPVCRRVLASGQDHLQGSAAAAEGGAELAFAWSMHRVQLPESGAAALLHFVRDTSAQRQAEQALRSSERRYRQLVEQMNDGIFVVDENGRLTDVSAAGCRMLDLPAEQMIGQELVSLLWPVANDSRNDPTAAGVLAAIRAGDEVVRGELRFRRADASSFVGDVLGHRLPGNRLQLVVRDVTERRHAEQALLDNEERLRLAARTARFGVHDYDVATGEVTWSEELYEISGLPSSTPVRFATVVEIIHAEDRPRFVAAMTRALDPDGDGEFCEEFRIVRPDGSVRWVENRCRTVFGDDDAGQRVPRRNTGVLIDVTARRAAEAAVRAGERRVRLALQAARAAAWEWDVGTDAVRWSPEVFELYGLPPDAEAPSLTTWQSLVHTDDIGRVQTALEAALSGEKDEFRVEFRLANAPAGERWLLDIGRVEFDGDGEPVRMAGLTVDVTERKRFEHALEEADRRKDEFLAVLAHELRNPLAPLQTGLELLRAEAHTADERGVLDVMRRQLGYLVELVDDLLDVSRVRTGKITLRRRRLPMQDVVESALDSCAPLIAAKGHRVEVELAEQCLEIEGDQTRLVQIVTNLLTNAAKYTEPRGRIRIDLHRERDEVVLRVLDSGVGIDAETRATMWQMFGQVQPTGERSGGGLGIGLSLVKKLVELHGGTISAESAGRGHGSTFTVRLPALAEADEAPAATICAPDAAGGAGACRSRRVLVVDDNVDGATLFAMRLRLRGHEAKVAHDGPSALAIARSFEPEVVFCDIGLPGMDGHALARRLRADPLGSNALLVAVTGYGSDEDKQKSRSAGFDAHLTKPVQEQDVDALLELPFDPAGDDAERAEADPRGE